MALILKNIKDYSEFETFFFRLVKDGAFYEKDYRLIADNFDEYTGKIIGYIYSYFSIVFIDYSPTGKTEEYHAFLETSYIKACQNSDFAEFNLLSELSLAKPVSSDVTTAVLQMYKNAIETNNLVHWPSLSTFFIRLSEEPSSDYTAMIHEIVSLIEPMPLHPIGDSWESPLISAFILLGVIEGEEALEVTAKFKQSYNWRVADAAHFWDEE